MCFQLDDKAVTHSCLQLKLDGKTAMASGSCVSCLVQAPPRNATCGDADVFNTPATSPVAWTCGPANVFNTANIGVSPPSHDNCCLVRAH
jgi:hypothetical protein